MSSYYRNQSPATVEKNAAVIIDGGVLFVTGKSIGSVQKTEIENLDFPLIKL